MVVMRRRLLGVTVEMWRHKERKSRRRGTARSKEGTVSYWLKDGVQPPPPLSTHTYLL